MTHVPYHPHAHSACPHPLDTSVAPVGDAAGAAFNDNDKLDFFTQLSVVEVVYDKAKIYDIRTEYKALNGSQTQVTHRNTEGKWVARLELGKDEFVVRVSGKTNGGVVRLRVETNRGHYVEVGGTEGEAFQLQIPQAFGVKAFVGRVGDQLMAIGAVIRPIFMRRSIESQFPTRREQPCALPFPDSFPRNPENSGLRRIGLTFTPCHFLSLESCYWPEDRESAVPFPAVSAASTTGDVFDLGLNESLTAVHGTIWEGLVTSLGFETNKGRKRSWGTPKGTIFRDEVRPGHLAVGLATSMAEKGLAGVKLDVSYPLP